jgi:hypothetical protein
LEKNKFEFEFFNLHYDLGQYLSSNLEKEYNYYKFDLIYDYHEIFNQNTNNYINNIINEISLFENNIKNELKTIYDEFINNYDKFASNFVNNDYINQLKTNYSICLIYSSLHLNETIKEDLIYSNYTEEIVNYILSNCTFDAYNFTFIDKKNNSINCLKLFSNQTEINLEKTKQFMICDENNILKDHFDMVYGKGFEYAYMYPGFTKVIQAVGRVIRGDKDKGIAILMDERFAYPSYQALMPPHWTNKKVITSTYALKKELIQFYNKK